MNAFTLEARLTGPDEKPNLGVGGEACDPTAEEEEYEDADDAGGRCGELI